MKFFITMSFPFLLASIASAQTTSGNPPATGRKTEECAISGIVVKLAGSEPVKTATVRLQRLQDLADTVSVVTDVSGRFELRGIDPWRYRLKVSRTDFVTHEYGQRTPNDPGAEIRLSPGQSVRDLLFRPTPWGVIAGRVLDEEGEPLPWAQVSALREVHSSGKRKLSPEALVPTNDLGVSPLWPQTRPILCQRHELLVSITPADSRVSARVVGSSFVLKDVFDGTYRLRVIGQSKDCSVQDADTKTVDIVTIRTKVSE